MIHKNRSIEFSALKVFATVAKSLTLTQAAERLGITQSGVSQALKQLESQTGTSLVVRSSRPIKLTPSGQVLYHYADKFVSDMQRMLMDVGTANQGTVGKLNIGMIDSFCDISGEKFVRFIKPFSSKIALRTGLLSPLSQALLDRDLDMLITSDPMSNHPELESYPIYRDPFVMVIAKDLCPTDKSLQWISRNIPFIQYDKTTLLGITTNLLARRLKITLNTYYELDSTQAMLRFVGAGYGWAIIPGLCLVGSPELLTDLNIMNLDDGRNARYISLLARHGELATLPAQAAEVCRSICEEEVVPKITAVAPWLKGQAYSIVEPPTI
jgi:DNA-binding transcriptional LysR family regulator